MRILSLLNREFVFQKQPVGPSNEAQQKVREIISRMVFVIDEKSIPNLALVGQSISQMFENKF